MKIGVSHLRIALVASSLARAGAEKQFVYAARALRAIGADVRVFYLGEGGYYERVLREHKIPLANLSAPGRPLTILRRLFGQLLRFRPEIVVASQFGDICHAGLAGRATGAFTIGGVRNDGVWEINTYQKRSRWMLRLPHALLANSHRAKQNLIERGINVNRIEVLPNVIDLREFDARAAEASAIPFAPDRVVVAGIGRLNPCKRFDRFVDALAIARKSVPMLAGIIVGADEGERVELERRSLAAGLGPEQLMFLGEIANVPALLAKVHMVVLTSDAEGCPNVLLEAMAARRPIITTPAGDAAMLVRHGVSGFVTEFDNVDAIASHMIRLANSPELRNRIGQAGRGDLEANYSVDSLPEGLGSAYARLAVQCGYGRLQLEQTSPTAEPSGAFVRVTGVSP